MEGKGKDDEYVKTEEGSEYVGIEGCQEANRKGDARKRDKEIDENNEEEKKG